MLARRALIALLLLVPLRASAETPVAEARALIARYHEDRMAVDRARDLLEAALTRESPIETMIMLSYVSFLWGDVRATTTDEKLAAYAPTRSPATSTWRCRGSSGATRRARRRISRRAS